MSFKPEMGTKMKILEFARSGKKLRLRGFEIYGRSESRMVTVMVTVMVAVMVAVMVTVMVIVMVAVMVTVMVTVMATVLWSLW